VAEPHSNGHSFTEDFHRRLSQARGSLSNNDARIADYIREHMAELPFHTADSLAEEVGVSRAGVVRLTQRLGYKGFVEVRNSSRKDLQTATSPLQRFVPDRAAPLFSQMLAQDAANLELTGKLVADLIPQAVRMLTAADQVYVVANSKSYGLAIYFQHLLNGVRPRVKVLHPWFRQLAIEMTADDLLVACIFQRYSRETVRIIDFAARQSIPILAITDGGGHDFLRGVDLSLIMHTDSPTLYRSMVAPIALIQTIAAEVAVSAPEVARRVLEDSERFNKGHEFMGE
jgi:DNA-binding MurR/RpiR family transcriptional regulator